MKLLGGSSRRLEGWGANPAVRSETQPKRFAVEGNTRFRRSGSQSRISAQHQGEVATGKLVCPCDVDGEWHRTWTPTSEVAIKPAWRPFLFSTREPRRALEYNSPDMSSAQWAAKTNDDWKRWEGQSVEGKFHLRQYLGGSDDTAVFLTEFGERPQRAAIKLTVASPENAESQLSSLSTTATLSHPHLLRLFQTGRCRLANTDLLYVVMEYAEEDLSQILPQRPLSPAEAQQMLLPVLDALTFLHAKGFVHGHLKPANIMAVGDQLKISGDRLLKAGESTARGIKPSVYDAPEIASRGVLPAADVWSLGMTLVESLTQQPPRVQKTPQQEPSLPATIPEPFLDIARHCLLRDPRSRWRAGDIKARLRPAESVSHPQGGSTILPRSRKWHYLLPIMAGIALLAILAGAKLLKSPPKALPEAVSSPAKAPEQPNTQPEPQPDTKATSGGIPKAAVVNQVVPDVPKQARDTIQGTVKVTVRVAVDSSGNVTATKLESPGPSKYFADRALQAARGWTFTPAEIDGRKVPSEWMLRFQFARSGSRVLPVQAAP